MIQVFSRSEPGGHAVNEDAYEVRLLPQGYICAVADGQGGRAGGGLAAKVACQTCVEAAVRYPPPELLRSRTWDGILQNADKVVADHPDAGFTTLVAFCITGRQICGASSGDSAAVLLNGNQTTEVLTARQHKNPPIGSGSAVFAGFTANLMQPWTVLAMSDGVWKYAGLDNVLRIAGANRSEEMIDLMRRPAQLQRTGGLQDDFTLVVFMGDAA